MRAGLPLIVSAVSCAGIACFVAAGAQAQDAFAPPPTQSAPSSSTQDNTNQTATSFSDDQSDLADRTSTTTSSAQTAPMNLSSDQIIQMLQQNPGLVVEIKSQVADRLQQQGTSIDENSISDQMLYEQIAANPDLRASITTFLRARGYVSQSDLAAPVSRGATRNATGTDDDPAMLQSLGAARLPTDAAFGGTFPAGTNGRLPLGGYPLGSTSAAGANRTPVQRPEEVNASTDDPKVLRQPAPYNLQSMRDLYTQIPERSVPLKRFGSEVFLNRYPSAMARGSAGGETQLDVPLGPDYVVGAGDALTIDMWGGITQSISRTVDRDGHVLLPEAGSVQVAGLPLQRAESLIAGALKQQYRNVQVSVTISRLRSIRVYVVGDVQRPGGYDISSLATPLSALYAAGGPTAAGSLRVARHLRGQQVIEEIDLYDFLLHGMRGTSVHFESGDTLLVPPAGAQAAITGAVKRPAIYELKTGDATLASLIDDAGGVTAAASFGHVTVERIDANRQRETVTLQLPGEHTLAAEKSAANQFALKDGDRIRIAPILSYSEKAIYLQGHVVRPGRLPFTEGMRLGEVLHSYRDMLPEPAAHGEIVRLVPPDLHAETIAFDVPEVLIGNDNPALQPFDTIRIFGRYEIDSPKVTIHGEVLRPGEYPLSIGMTASQLVRMAGGFKRDALLESADLTSYSVANGSTIFGALATVPIGAAVAGTNPGADVALKPGDVLTIHQITGWDDIGESVTVEGQVRFPGSYGFREGERLSSILRRAGGLRDTAYPDGAVLIRDQVRDLEQKSRDELIRQIETNSASARLSPALGAGGDTGGTLELIKAQQEQALSSLRSHPPTGRMVIHIGADISTWANTDADIELRRGDVLTIPKQPGFVLVTGQVYNATALTFTPGKTAKWYLSHAGGTNTSANRKEIFVIRANGSVIGRHSEGWPNGDVLSTKLNPGDVVVVPQKIIGASLFWRNLLATAQVVSSIGITAGIAAAAL
jgi:protein involved in polysaccharide export with SLBB domain